MPSLIILCIIKQYTLAEDNHDYVRVRHKDRPPYLDGIMKKSTMGSRAATRDQWWTELNIKQRRKKGGDLRASHATPGEGDCHSPLTKRVASMTSKRLNTRGLTQTRESRYKQLGLFPDSDSAALNSSSQSDEDEQSEVRQSSRSATSESSSSVSPFQLISTDESGLVTSSAPSRSHRRCMGTNTGRPCHPSSCPRRRD